MPYPVYPIFVDFLPFWLFVALLLVAILGAILF